MKRLFLTLVIMLTGALCAVANNGGDSELNPGSVIIGHVSDAHSWHICEIEREGKDPLTIGISLPVILINEGHVDVFSSAKFHNEDKVYNGYKLVGGGLEKEEIICVDTEGNPLLNAEGAVVKPVDISITKTSAAIMLATIMLIVIIFVARAGYKKRENQAPKGVQSIVEMLVVFVRDNIARPMIGEKHYEKYLPYLLTLFFFIFFCNVLALIPIFPAGGNITGNIAVTAILALITFFITNISGNKHYWVDIFNTPGVPAWLKIFPLMPVIELVGVFTKPIVLMIRLFANMTAGHIVMLGFIVIVFILSNVFGVAVGGAVSVVSVLFSVFIGLLECLVAYIQAFVFTMLTALYIGMAVAEPHHAEA
ncbi:MAG: F0F1 ATP synthase subunit A [Bacteroidales bacterium]|nr:F0F1 ATP synthase subunit A [Bacteroidales bacterium]